VATAECVLFGHDVELAGWRSRSRTRCECQRFPGSHCRRLPEGNWGLGALADDVALIVAEFSSSAWTHGDLPITVRLWLQDGSSPLRSVILRAPPLALFCGNASVPAERVRRGLAGWSLASAPLGDTSPGPRRADRRCQNRLIRPTSLLIGMILM
jgi:hypothetical protein